MAKSTILSVVFCLIMACSLQWTTGYKILLYPGNMKSHFIYFGEFGSALLEKKHEVHMIVPSNAKLPPSLHHDIKISTYRVNHTEDFTGSAEYALYQVQSIEASEQSFYDWVTISTKMFEVLNTKLAEECDTLMSNDKFVTQLINNNYDILIYDPLDFRCSPALVYKLGIPMAIVSLPCLYWFYRVPTFLSSVPLSFMEHTSNMTFIERLKNVLMELTMIKLLDQSATYIQKYLPEKEISTMEIIQNATLWFYLHSTVTHYPHPLMPNTIDIGGLMMRQGKPLPQDYAVIVNETKHPVVLMSLGSYLKHIPSKWEDKFCEAFNKVNSNIIIIWKTSIHPKCDLPLNVLVRSWVPQNDLLAHPNVKLFITHSGWNSYIEAAYHATPVIAFPYSADQPHNALAIERKGVGKKMSIVKFQPNDLVMNIHEVLQNLSYIEKARAMSKMLHHTDITAKDKINFWVEHVIQFGGQHLRSSGYNMSMVEFLMLDIFAAILVAFTIVFVVIICIIMFVFKAARYCLVSRASKEKRE